MEVCKMSLFTKPKSLKFKLIPSTPEQDSARSYLTGLQNNQLDFPVEPTADLTPAEQQIQGQLPKLLTNNQTDYETSRSYLNDVMSGKYDPRTSDYYQGLRQEQEQLKSGAQLNVRRGAQKAGMARSTPSQGIQADVGQQYDTQTLKELGALYENERNRMGSAATALPEINSQFISNVGNAENIAAVERQNQQKKLTAIFTAAIQTMLAPYTYNAQIASALLNEQRYASYETGGGPTDLGFGLQVAGMAAAAIATGGLAAGALGGTAALGTGGALTTQGMEVANAAGKTWMAEGAGGLSDIRVKENIVPIKNAVEKIKTLTGYTFNYIKSPDERDGGVMAQELEKVLPDAVVEVDGVKMVKYTAVIGLLISAVKELADRQES
jgi:hypothetical protein